MLTIESLLPNPIGPDTGTEWIKLVNHGAEAIDLNNWKIKDASGKTFTLSGNIAPQSEIVLKNSQTKIVLNNDADTVSLYDQTERLVDSLSYENPSEGEIITHIATSASATSVKPISTVINTNKTIQSTTLNFAPVAVGLLIAVIMGVVAALAAKYFSANDNDGKI
jgi:hypothetical protein